MTAACVPELHTLPEAASNWVSKFSAEAMRIFLRKNCFGFINMGIFCTYFWAFLRYKVKLFNFTFLFHCFSVPWLFFFPAHFSVLLVKLLLLLYQERLYTLLIKLPVFLFHDIFHLNVYLFCWISCVSKCLRIQLLFYLICIFGLILLLFFACSTGYYLAK